MRLLDGDLVLYVHPARQGGETVGDVLDLLEDGGLRPGIASPDHWVHVSPGGGGGNACPAVEPEETGLTEPWPPIAPQAKGSEVSVVVVDTGWHPPAATDPRTPWLKGVQGDDELNGPDLRPYAGHGTFIAGGVRRTPPETKVYVEGSPSAASVVAASSSPRSSCSSRRRSVTTRRSSTSRPAAAPGATDPRSRCGSSTTGT